MSDEGEQFYAASAAGASVEAQARQIDLTTILWARSTCCLGSSSLQGVAVNVLQKTGLDLETVRLEVENKSARARTKKQVGNIPHTPRVKKVLNLASKEAKQLQHLRGNRAHFAGAPA